MVKRSKTHNAFEWSKWIKAGALGKDMRKYRALIIKKVIKRPDGGLCILFINSIISLEFSQKDVAKYNLQNVQPLKLLFVQGRRGNDDISLWGVNVMENAILN